MKTKEALPFQSAEKTDAMLNAIHKLERGLGRADKITKSSDADGTMKDTWGAILRAIERARANAKNGEQGIIKAVHYYARF